MKNINKKIKELEEKNEELKIKSREFDYDMAVKKIYMLSAELEKSREEATKYKDLYLKQIDINIRLVEKGGD